jgi:uncharacterized protein
MKELIINCPTCSKAHNYYQSKPWSPFCSQRCHLIDLGAWAGEEHRIKGKSLSAQEFKIHSQNKNDFIN